MQDILDGGGGDATTSCRADDEVWLSVRCLDDGGGNGGQRPLSTQDKIVRGGEIAKVICGVRGGEVVHLVVENYTIVGNNVGTAPEGVDCGCQRDREARGIEGYDMGGATRTGD